MTCGKSYAEKDMYREIHGFCREIRTHIWREIRDNFVVRNQDKFCPKKIKKISRQLWYFRAISVISFREDFRRFRRFFRANFSRPRKGSFIFLRHILVNV